MFRRGVDRGRLGIRDRFRALLQVDAKPSVIALAAAVGIFIAASPWIGAHTLMALGASFFFRLPLYPLMLATYVTNPFTMPFIYAGLLKLGLVLTGQEFDFPLDWGRLGFADFLSSLKPLFWPFVVGTHVGGLALSVFTYFVIYYIIRKYKRQTQ